MSDEWIEEAYILETWSGNRWETAMAIDKDGNEYAIKAEIFTSVSGKDWALDYVKDYATDLHKRYPELVYRIMRVTRTCTMRWVDETI